MMENPQTNGEVSSPDKELQRILDEVEPNLEKFEEKHGIRPINIDSSLSKYLELTQEEILLMSSRQLRVAVVILARHAYSINKLYNKENARANWADSNIKLMAGPYVGYGIEDRMLKAIYGSERAKKLDRIRRWARARADRLDFLANRIKFIAESMSNMAENLEKGNG